MNFKFPLVREKLHKFQAFIYSQILASIEAALRLKLPIFLWVYSLDSNESVHTLKLWVNPEKDPFLAEKTIFHVLLPHTVHTHTRSLTL